jgi:hypothetical protein
MKEDNLDEYLDKQEELKGELELEQAIEAAKQAGIDVAWTVKSAKDGWKVVQHPPTTVPAPFELSADALAKLKGLKLRAWEAGITNERAWIIYCLQEAVKNKAK